MLEGRNAEIHAVVNITEDSFSDGGAFLDPARALAHARELIEDGADVVELGPASSHPEARQVDPEEEIRRIAPVLDGLRDQHVAISVDSWRPETQRYAIERGVDFLNDVRGFPDDGIYPELAAADCRLVVMHSVGGGSRALREVTDSATVLHDIDAFFERRIAEMEAAGISRERIVLDPGMGLFLGANPEPSVAVLRALPGLKERFHLPVMISLSRKSVVGRLGGRPVGMRGASTLAAELYAIARGADIIRTHDAGALRDALKVLAALEDEEPEPGRRRRARESPGSNAP